MIIQCNESDNDHVTGDPVRGADGLAVECDPGEAGELIGER